MVVDGITVAVAPLNVFELPLKVCTPVLAVNVVAALDKLSANEKTAAACSFQTAPLFKVTAPVNVFVPVALVKLIVPEILVAPDTDKAYPPIDNTPPASIVSVVILVGVASIVERQSLLMQHLLI